MIKVHIADIQWDTDGVHIPELPVEIMRDFEFNGSEDAELEDFLSNWLSDTYGFCHYGFRYKIVKP